MIKLSKIYSNKEHIFTEIKFKEGLNVVFASVSKKADKKSSHSLGKTTLVDIIDFCFLKQIKKGHVLKNDCFSDFIFFLEIEYDVDKFVTIRRPVSGKISITIRSEKYKFNVDDVANWDYQELAFKNARETLNKLICPKNIIDSGFGYRNGLRYCLRKQTHYENTFKVNSSRESDANWVPYLSSIIGIDVRKVHDKYESNRRVESLKNAVTEINSL